jgi:hypothetical protein
MWFLILMTMLQQPATAEVFKCIGKQGSVSYQPIPCPEANQKLLEINSDPAKEATASAKLDEVRGEYEARKAAQLEAEKQAVEQNYKAASLEVARRRVLALQELAAAKRRQTDILKHERRYQHKLHRNSVRNAKR